MKQVDIEIEWDGVKASIIKTHVYVRTTQIHAEWKQIQNSARYTYSKPHYNGSSGVKIILTKKQIEKTQADAEWKTIQN